MSIIPRVANLWRREQLDAEIEAELQSHLEMAAADAERAGMSPAEARRDARIRFGNPLAIRERTAEADLAVLLEATWRDVRHALRQLRRSPVFTTTAVLTLALGIGATTAVFTLVEQVMLRQLPVARPDQLWRIGDAVRCCYRTGYAQNNWSFFSWEAYKHFREGTPAFEELAAFQVGQVQLGIRAAGSSDAAEARIGQYVSGNFFRTLGIHAARGRLFTDADDQYGAPLVAVMSFHSWEQRYGSDPSVIGATYVINGHPFTLIGVTPKGFFGAKAAASGMPDVWLPLTTEPLLAGATTRLENPAVAWLDLLGRVRPDVNPTTLEARLRLELQQWLASHVADMTPQEAAVRDKQTLNLTPGGSGVSLLRENYRDSLRLLLLAASCVLLVACANIANLLLARGLKARHETALRAALGASRARLVRKALAESLTLSAIGALAGIAVAYAGARFILHLAFSDKWVAVDASPSTPVLLFALGLSVVTGIVFGVAPALTISRADPIDAMQGGTRTVGRNRHWSQQALLVAQAAVSLVLLSAAAMLGQSVSNLQRHDFGFEVAGRYLVWINSILSNAKPEQMAPRVRELEVRLRAIPGVRMASLPLYAPLSGYYWSHAIQVEDRPEPSVRENTSSAWTRVTPGFFETVGQRIVMGRPLSDDDNASTRAVAVINEAFAKHFFAGQNPLGRHFGPGSRKNARTYEIVGVVADVRFRANPGDAMEPMYFVPEAQTTHFDDASLDSREVWSHYPYSIVIWAPGDPINLAAQVKAALAAVDPGIVLYRIQPYADVIRTAFSQQNMIASLTSIFSGLALLLAAVGLYGVTAYGVEQRVREIGVRMALGADSRSVLATVLRGAFRPIGFGLVLGIPSAIAAGHLISAQLFGVSPWDPLMLSMAALLLGLAALGAALIPARRAASVSPMQALRT
jgi:predicted permease